MTTSKLQVGIFPRVAAILLILGVPLFASGVFLPQFLRTIGAILAGLSLIWMGLGMSRQGSADTTQHTPAA